MSIGQDVSIVRRRHVLFVMGYDPRGVRTYYSLFRNQLKQAQKIWPIAANVGPLDETSEDVAAFTVESAGPNWEVVVRYEGLRLDHAILTNLTQPLAIHVYRALRWILTDIITGTTWRLWRASGRFAALLTYAHISLLIWIVLGGVAGAATTFVAVRWLGSPELIGLAAGFLVGIGVFRALLPLASYIHVHPLTNGWPYFREYARGRPTTFDRPVEIFAERLVTAAKAGEADEILVIGHSGGGALAPAIVARALERDSELGRHGPRIVLLTIGSILPGLALHPAANWIREIICRLAIESSILWIDCQTRRDLISFRNFDLITRLGLKLHAARYNPLLWNVGFRDMISPAKYKRMIWNIFRMHFQFIMANDRRAPYDYLMFICGPAPLEYWARNGISTLASFSDAAAYSPVGATISPQHPIGPD